MSRFHHPRRGWLPKIIDGLKLVVLSIFLIGYLAIAFQPSSTHYQTNLPLYGDGIQEDSSKLVDSNTREQTHQN